MAHSGSERSKASVSASPRMRMKTSRPNRRVFSGDLGSFLTCRKKLQYRPTSMTIPTKP